MPRLAPVITSLNAGYFSPLLKHRSDLKNYPNAAQVLDNFIPLVQGAIKKRPGTMFVSTSRQVGDYHPWLIPFVYSDSNSVVIEAGDNYFRFYVSEGLIVNDDGTPYEVETPYTLENITGEDGCLTLDFARVGDVLYLANGKYPLAKLSRYGTLDWRYESVDFTLAPFDDINPDNPITIKSSVNTGDGTITFSDVVTNASFVGCQIYIEENPDYVYLPWEVETAYSAGDFVIVDGNIYEAITSATSGSDTPVHLDGTRSDGGVNWIYRHSTYGVVKTTNSTGGIKVSSYIGNGATTLATAKWALQAFREDVGYPTHVTFFRERMVLVRKARFWLSVVGDFENFATRDGFDATSDMAIVIDVSDDATNDVTWVAGIQELLFGTSSAEYMIAEVNDSDVFANSNVAIYPQSRKGGRAVKPYFVGKSLVFAGGLGQRLFAMKYDYESDLMVSANLNLTATDILRSKLIQISFADNPDEIIWAITKSGELKGLTFNQEQDVIGWHSHSIAGSDGVFAVATIPNNEISFDQSYFVVKRGAAYVIEKITTHYDYYNYGGLGVYMDSAVIYEGIPADEISGIDHLEGLEVVIVADGVIQNSQVVMNQKITLASEASHVVIGLDYTARLLTMPIDVGTQNGSSQGEIKRISKADFSLFNSMGGKAGFASNLDDFSYDDNSIFSGKKSILFPSGYDEDAEVEVHTTLPAPFCLRAIITWLETENV